MRIALLHDMLPFRERESDQLAQRCIRELRTLGHDARLVGTPAVDADSARLLAASLVIRGAERVIGLSFPASLMAAPGAERIIWALDCAPSEEAEADFRQMLSASRLYGSSALLCRRIEESTGLRSVLLSAPALDDEAGWRAVAEELAS